MKGQGKDLGSVKAYTEGKADLAQAEAGATGLTQSMKKIPEVFPPGTGATSTDGKCATKPAIWIGLEQVPRRAEDRRWQGRRASCGREERRQDEN